MKHLICKPAPLTVAIVLIADCEKESYVSKSELKMVRYTHKVAWLKNTAVTGFTLDGGPG